MSLSPAELRGAFAAQTLFEAKTWRLSPEAWPLTGAQVAELEAIGAACLEFHQALETLYLRSAAGRNLLRNRPLIAPWVAEYLDRGKPPELIAHGRHPANRGALPTLLRPDLLLTAEGWALTELDSVPGGVGLTAFLNRLYAGTGEILGAGDALVTRFHAALAALRPAVRNPVIALVVSAEAETYRPELEWLAQQLQLQGQRVHCVRPEELFPLGSTLCLAVDGNPERIEIIYRFFELFDLPNIPAHRFILDAWAAGEVAVAPPLRAFQEEKLSLALFHHPRLRDFWGEVLSAGARRILSALIPPTWIVDPAPLPPGAVLDGPLVGGRPLHDWRELASASQRERDLILKISGFHESAWGARGVTLGSDVPREVWQAALEQALAEAAHHPRVLQVFRKPRLLEHPIYPPDAVAVTDARSQPGRLRLCPYFTVAGGQARLSGALATFCPADKKIIHGMQDAALLPCRRTD